ncbi:Ig-like domain-containing protein, partial [Aliarcobacter butzleri]
VSVNGKEYTTTVNTEGTTWSVNVNTPELLADRKVTATVTATDDAGNSKTEKTERP